MSKAKPLTAEQCEAAREAMLTGHSLSKISRCAGVVATIEYLISVTGLSRSVFAKPHIREVLVEYGIIQTQTPEKTAGAESTRRMDRLIAEKNGYIQRLLHENEQLRYEVELLRGKVHILTHKAAAQGEELF